MSCSGFSVSGLYRHGPPALARRVSALALFDDSELVIALPSLISSLTCVRCGFQPSDPGSGFAVWSQSGVQGVAVWRGLGFKAWSLGRGFGVWGLGFGVWSLGCGVWGLRCEAWDVGLRVQVAVFRGSGLGLIVDDL